MTSLEHALQDQRAIDELVARGLAALPDVCAARRAAEALSLHHSDRAVFALCLLTLELARAGDAQAREELPGHVGVLLEAWGDPGLATLLTAGNPELATRWERVRPIVGEFLELQQAPARHPTPGPIPRLATPVELLVEIQELLEGEPAKAPEPLPRQATPAELFEEIQEFVEEEPPALPPPPPAAALDAGQAARPSSPPPPPPPPFALQVASPDEQTQLFWHFAEEALGRLPSPEKNLVGARSFGSEKAGDRARLVRFAHSALARFPRCEHARALASLVLLYTGSQEKQRGLLGVNRERIEALRTGLSLIGDPGPAGAAAVLFENDGPATLERFAGVVELMSSFLAFCARRGLDPRLPETQARFCSAP